jgi:hypothetical protein
MGGSLVMPCTDIQEELLIRLDQHERLISYHYAKKTCGKLVGAQGLLNEVVAGTSIDEVLSWTTVELLKHFPKQPDDGDLFLLAKHLHALQASLQVYVGSGDEVQEFCSLDGISNDGNEVVVHTSLVLPYMDGQIIPSCGQRSGGKSGCASCSR